MWYSMLVFITTECEVWILPALLKLFDSLEPLLHFTLFFKVVETKFLSFFFVLTDMRIELVLADKMLLLVL